ncbi:MAG TPA: GGDEF domain-containing protein [Leptospiraceae bacterium]|nr:GGDEF domain-containing protein [Leptospiraceae bacterium]HMW05823.1 GGDEF domain-containing protein [Leptospiraceae bacterium]HMX35604.1 GGDEF domain-containing protein [Leptospiraceae bacterium]HMY33895.1 GGDEF domain-containing protein [Leptospiraceae bacterium]HMZ65869.1 GGDEF domain-containing protein [Leptospiraceae bacterium]
MHQSFPLHHSTLLVVLAAVTFITTTLLVIAALFSDKNKSMILWAKGNVFICLGFVVGALYFIPSFFYSVICYVLMGTGMGYIYAGIKKFINEDVHRSFIPLVSNLAGIGPMYYLYWDDSLSGRLLVSSIYFGIINLICAWTFLKPSKTSERGASILAGSGFLCMGLALLSRGIFIIKADLNNPNHFQSIETGTIFLTSILQIWTTVALIILIMNRYANQILNISITDSLTNTFNRTGLNSLGLAKLKKAELNQIPMAIILFDADHFKSINDMYGHLTGDKILTYTAETAKKNLREKDLIARFGGEEFVVILEDVSSQESYLLSEKLRDAIAKNEYFTGNESVHCSISIGVASTEVCNTYNLYELIDIADKALYKAKAEGRNRVVLSG